MTNSVRPGERKLRLARLVEESISRTKLDLSGCRVLTEAASGPYVVTPIIAALAGAEVTALTRDSRYGSAEDVARGTIELADILDVRRRVEVRFERTVDMFAAADVITNSGHVRPITGQFAEAIRVDAVVALMFEKWEIQAGRVDLDLDLLHGRGVAVAGTNERHPAVDVFSYLGPMAVAQLSDAGVSAYGGRVALYCNNPFLEYVASGLRATGAQVAVNPDFDGLLSGPAVDAIVIATTPGTGQALTNDQFVQLSAARPDMVVCQFWGDFDRAVLMEQGIEFWPPLDPGAGHMGVLPSRVGPEPIVRLQAGGLKVGQVLRTPPQLRTPDDLEWLDV